MSDKWIAWHKGTPPIRKIDFFRALPEKGGGRALPEFVDPFFHHVVVPYILTSVSCYVIVDFYIQEALFARIIPSSLEGKFWFVVPL